MKRIILVRHGKSSWRNQELPDIDRPLKARGINDAYVIGNELKEKGIHPDIFLSSPATRAISTATILARSINFPQERISLMASIYESNVEGLNKLIRNQSNNYDSILVIGHDPILTNFINHHCKQTLEKTPTCATVFINAFCDVWDDVGRSSTLHEMTEMIMPKELKK